MKRLAPRGIRSRLLATIALVVATALVLMTAGFNAILRHSLDDNATTLAHARAAAALATVQVTDGRLSVREAPDDDAIDGQIWIFDTRGRIEAPPSASKALDQAASRLAGARPAPSTRTTRACTPRRSSPTASAPAPSSPASGCGPTTRPRAPRCSGRSRSRSCCSGSSSWRRAGCCATRCNPWPR